MYKFVNLYIYILTLYIWCTGVAQNNWTSADIIEKFTYLLDCIFLIIFLILQEIKLKSVT